MKSNDIKILDDGWMEVPFSYMAEHISKRVDPKDTDLDIYIGLEHIDPGSLKIKRHGKPEDVKGTKLIAQPGDIIFGKRRAYQGKVGICEWDAIVSAHSMVLRPKEENIEKDFLKFFMQSEEFYNRSIQISEGSLSPTIKWKVLEEQKFIIPTKSKQKELVDILNCIEKEINTKESLKHAYIIYKQKVLGDIFNKGLNHKEFKDSCIGKIPNSWNIKKLSDVISEIESGRRPKGGVSEDGDIPSFGGENIKQDGGVIYTEVKKVSRKFYNNLTTGILKNKDVLINKDGANTGKVGLYSNNFYEEASINEHLFLLRGKKEYLTQEYLYYYLLSPKGQKYIYARTTGSAQPGITRSFINNFYIPLPSLSEQDNICRILYCMDNIIEKLNVSINTSKINKMNILNSIINLKNNK